MLSLNNYYFKLDGSGGGTKVEGTLDINNNGIYDVSTYASANVSVGSGQNKLDALIDGSVTELFTNATTIKGYAFKGCPNLISVAMPNATTITLSAFENCSSLTTVDLANIITIGNGAFYGCSKIKRIILPKATTVEQKAFLNCGSLEYFEVYTLSKFNYNMLNNCGNLRTIVIRNDSRIVYLAYTNALEGTPIISGDGFVYVPRKYLSDDDATMDYRRATNWASLTNMQFRVLEDYTVDGTIYGELDLSKI